MGRPWRRWEDNIGMDLKEIGINTRNLVDLSQGRDYWRALGLKRNENGEWIRLHNEELYSFFLSLNIVRMITSRRLRRARHVARMEEGKYSFKILKSKPTRKRLCRRPSRRKKDNIRTSGFHSPYSFSP